jgi:hypothetical protein
MRLWYTYVDGTHDWFWIDPDNQGFYALPDIQRRRPFAPDSMLAKMLPEEFVEWLPDQ